MGTALRDRAAFFTGMNNYVSAMAYASNLSLGEPAAFSLGSPAAVSANVIAAATAANAAAATKVAYAYTSDSRYGRTLRLTPSGDPGNSVAIDIFGRDYLGQPMVERFTGANGATAILYGKKAFYTVDYSKVVTPATNAVTWAIGTGFRLGLPYKGDVAWAKEGGIFVLVHKRDVTFYFDRAPAEAVAGSSRWLRAPFPGFVKTLIGTPNGGGGATDPVITVKLATVAIVGLTVTVDTSDTAGTTVTDAPTTLGYNANNRFIANGLIEVVSAAAAGAFGDRLGLELTPTHVTVPDLADPQTTTTGDPRGTYESLAVLDGATEIVVGLVGDAATNSSGNGGLHGIRHVVA